MISKYIKTSDSVVFTYKISEMQPNLASESGIKIYLTGIDMSESGIHVSGSGSQQIKVWKTLILVQFYKCQCTFFSECESSIWEKSKTSYVRILAHINALFGEQELSTNSMSKAGYLSNNYRN